jgi:aminocarboxymuconate-semialdehyde decarboxylase
MIDYHAHLGPEAALAAATAKRFMPFPSPPPRGLIELGPQFEEMDRLGMTERHISVPPILYGYELPLAEQVDHVRAMNDWLIEAVDHRRLHRTGILPLSDPAEAIRELERLVGAGVRSVAIGTHVHGAPLDAALPDDFWAALAVHTDFVLMHPWQVRNGSLLHDFGLGNSIGNPFETTLAATRLIAAGTMGRHPGLQMILSHGGGALPFLVGRIDRAWKASGAQRPDPIKEARRFFYDIVVFQPQQLRHVIDVVGIDRVIIGTDSPFDMNIDNPGELIAAAGFDIKDFQGERIPRKA